MTIVDQLENLYFFYLIIILIYPPSLFAEFSIISIIPSTTATHIYFRVKPYRLSSELLEVIL